VLEGHRPESGSPSADDDVVARVGEGVLVEGDDRSVTIATPDGPRVFSRVVGVLALHGQSVRAAAVRSIPNGPAISRFELEPNHPGAKSPDWTVVAGDVERILRGDLPLEPRLEELSQRSRRLQRPTAAWSPEPRVFFDNEGSRAATIVEIRAADATGLLFRITCAFADLDLDIRSARVMTMGHEVVDTFYVVTRDGTKIGTVSDLERIEHALLAAMEAADIARLEG